MYVYIMHTTYNSRLLEGCKVWLGIVVWLKLIYDFENFCLFVISFNDNLNFFKLLYYKDMFITWKLQLMISLISLTSLFLFDYYFIFLTKFVQLFSSRLLFPNIKSKNSIVFVRYLIKKKKRNPSPPKKKNKKQMSRSLRAKYFQLVRNSLIDRITAFLNTKIDDNLDINVIRKGIV